MRDVILFRDPNAKDAFSARAETKTKEEEKERKRKNGFNLLGMDYFTPMILSIYGLPRQLSEFCVN